MMNDDDDDVDDDDDDQEPIRIATTTVMTPFRMIVTELNFCTDACDRGIKVSITKSSLSLIKSYALMDSVFLVGLSDNWKSDLLQIFNNSA